MVNNYGVLFHMSGCVDELKSKQNLLPNIPIDYPTAKAIDSTIKINK